MTPWLRNVPPDMLADLKLGRTSLCRLLKIMPTGGPAFGITSLNRKVRYDDTTDDGEVSYCARYGFDPSAIAASSGTAIDNAEFTALLGVPDANDAWGITDEMIDSGYLDGARFVQYMIDYEQLTPGRHVELHSGKLGQVRLPRKGVAIIECRDRMQQLAQHSVCVVDSLTCRNTFGVNKNGVGCFADAEALWVEFTVTDVMEADRLFASDDLTQDDDHFFPGKVEWITGNNAGRAVEVEEFAGGIVSLAHITRGLIQVGDTGRIRPDCTKIKNGDRGCKFYGQILNMDAEADIPEGESRNNQTPRPT